LDILVKAMAKDEPILVIGLVNTVAVEKARLLHDTFPTASAALGRTITGAVLLASMLKEGQKISLQIVGDGPLKEVFAEADWLCRVRGYVRKPHVHLGLLGDSLDVGRGIGSGFLHVTKDLGIREPYHGSVPLQTGEVASDLAYYLATSEQMPAAVSLGVFVDQDNSVKASGGFMVHALPGADEEVIEYLEDRISRLRPVSSMVLDGLKAEEIVGEVLGMPFDVLETKEVSYSCPCTRERVMAALVTLGEKDIAEMAEKGESLSIQCHFCKTDYTVSQEELFSLLKSLGGSS
jgi:molecular chaperone Hsp33